MSVFLFPCLNLVKSLWIFLFWAYVHSSLCTRASPKRIRPSKWIPSSDREGCGTQAHRRSSALRHVFEAKMIRINPPYLQEKQNGRYESKHCTTNNSVKHTPDHPIRKGNSKYQLTGHKGSNEIHARFKERLARETKWEKSDRATFRERRLKGHFVQMVFF